MSDQSDPKKPRIGKKGVAVGIGSAAIAAALIYASRRRKKQPGPDPRDFDPID